MKTPEEIKKGIECCKTQFAPRMLTVCNIECPYYAEGTWCRNVLAKDNLAYIRQLEAENANLKAQNAELVKKLEQRKEFTISFPIDTQEMVKKAIDSFDIDGKPFIEWVELLKDYKRHEWISVEDRLPEEPCAVLVFLYDSAVCVAWYSRLGRFETGSGMLVSAGLGINHWMPLPEPPKEEQ